VLAAITRITNAEAEAAGAPRPPAIDRLEGTDLVYNDPALAQRMRGVLESALGKGEVVSQEANYRLRGFFLLRGAGNSGILF